ncbi:MAG: hypothetical protein IPJ34_25345 [Myxococcales bacterium]|nr:hypothetical protein [Myxococcales bacterium]
MSESSKYFEGTSQLHETVRALSRRLEQLGVDYAVVGGLALTAHGYARMTEDVDILVTPASLKRIHTELVGRGYRHEFAGSKNLRDTRTQVRVEFVLTGAFPGSGQPQPLCFPDPTDSERLEVDGVDFAGLTPLLELKLAAGLTGGPERRKDWVDVQALIRARTLSRETAERLHPYVRATYLALWDELHASHKRYVRRSLHPLADGASLEAALAALEVTTAQFATMQAQGVVLERSRYAWLVTTDPVVARTYDLHDATEFVADDF